MTRCAASIRSALEIGHVNHAVSPFVAKAEQVSAGQKMAGRTRNGWQSGTAFDDRSELGRLMGRWTSCRVADAVIAGAGSDPTASACAHRRQGALLRSALLYEGRVVLGGIATKPLREAAVRIRPQRSVRGLRKEPVRIDVPRRADYRGKKPIQHNGNVTPDEKWRANWLTFRGPSSTHSCNCNRREHALVTRLWLLRRLWDPSTELFAGVLAQRRRRQSRREGNAGRCRQRPSRRCLSG